MSGPQPPPSCFNENSPRPPVPGEEGEVRISTSSSSSSRSKHLQQQDLQSARRSSCDAICAPLGYEPEGRCDRLSIMEHQQQRSSSSSSSNSSSNKGQQLACLQWSRSLHTLLEDPKGVKVFEEYLTERDHGQALSFWFGCEGLKDENDPNKLNIIFKAIVRRYFQRSSQLAIPDNIRKEVMRCYYEGRIVKDTFNEAQKEIYQLLEQAYPNFLRSDIYVKHIQICQSTKTPCSSSSLQHHQQQPQHHRQQQDDSENEDREYSYGSPDETCAASCASTCLLPTLHEDSELTTQHQQQLHHPHQQMHQATTHTTTPQHHTQHQSQTHHHQQQLHHPQSQSQQQQQLHQASSATDYKGEMRLTKDMLMATQLFRAKPEAFAGIYLQPGASPYHSQRRAQYSSYNPVSRQDSELQSLSSDARTESDNMSLTDASLSDTTSVRKRDIRKQYVRQNQHIKRQAMANRETDIRETIIPRTQLLPREHTQPKNPEEFATILIQKLERLKRERDTEEAFMRKMKEIEPREHCDKAASIGYSDSISSSMSTVVPKTVVPTRSMAENPFLQVEEDNDQAILDQHVSRVWSDLTPSRSPKVASPRPRSPDKLRRQGQIPAQPQGYPAARAQTYRRKERDVFSTFSGDSGNVHDFQESSEIYGVGSMSSLGSGHLPKSKSVPSDYADSLHTQDMYLQGQDQRNRRLDAQRSSTTKKSMTELTDSGVSVVSDATSAANRERVLREWQKNQGGCASGIKAETMNVNKLNRNKKFANSPQQPFIGDPGMPLLPQPHTNNDSILNRVLPVVSKMMDTKILSDGKKGICLKIFGKHLGYRPNRDELKESNATQLEEAKRRLEYEQYEQQNRAKQQRYPSGETMQTSMQSSVGSSQSTLRRGGKQEAPSDFTTVVFSFCEEKVPYRTKISGHNVTLKQFKDILPKKGNYRYFFKTECEELDMQVIQEEVTDDNDELPMWEGRIMAQVKALE